MLLNTMVTPRVLNQKKDKIDWTTSVFIGRPSKWGNPYRVDVDGSRTEVIALYESYIKSNRRLVNDLSELHGKNLVCFCSPKVCHGDVLLRLANPELFVSPLENYLDF